MEIDICPSDRMCAVAGCVSSALDDGAVILHFASGKYFGLNAVGSRIWSLLETPRSVCDIQAAIRAEYHVDPDVSDRDVRVLLSDLRQAGLIEVAIGATP